MPTPISELTRAMTDGSGPAIEEFYNEYFEFLFSRARRITGRDESFCMDIVQEVTLRTIRCIRPIENQQHFEAWLNLVIQSTVYDLLKAENRRTRREQKTALTRQVTTEIDPRVFSDDEFDFHRVEWLRNQISQLDPQLASIIDLRYQKSWTLHRIAESLGLSVATIDGRLRRAITSLKKAASSAYELDDENASMLVFRSPTIQPVISRGGVYDE